MTPRVYAIVVNWNLAGETVKCVRSLLRSHGTDLSVVIIDNGSTDGSVKEIRAKLPDVTLLLTGRNLGLAGGINWGIKHALEKEADWIFVLNNDAEVEPESISTLLDVGGRDPRIGVLGPLILYASQPETIWSLADREHRWLPVPKSIGRRAKNRGQFRTPMVVDYVTGCAMLIQCSVLEQVGLFDTRYFMYYEDADFCRRVRNKGYLIVAVPQARVLHKVASSSRNVAKEMRRLQARNRFWFYRSHPHGPHRALTYFYLLASESLTILFDVACGRLKLAQAGMQGLVEGMREPIRLKSIKVPKAECP